MRLILIISILVGSLSNAQVVINEYSAANYDDFTDNYNETEDWFELYNTGANTVDLNGYYLSDKANNPTKFLINSSVELLSNEHLTVFASGKNEITGTNIHTNFKIHQTKGNEWILLTAPDGVTLVDSIFVRPCQTNHSRGRIADGDNTWGVFTNPSPNNTNANSFTNYTETPTFSSAPGNYASAITLDLLTNEPNLTVYYTTDGSYPDASSTVYTGSLSINATSVIKAIAISDDNAYLNSFISYGTFFINDTYTVPILSISGTQVDNLLNGNGGIEPHGTFEYYKDGELVDKARGEFNEHGNDSWAYAQRGFDYITRDQFGYNHAIQNELFRTKDRDKYQRLIIKAAANDNYPYAYGGTGAHIRDAYVQSLSQVADLRMDERSYEPCILFLNGEYWGLYEIREKVDDIDFTDYYYDQDEGEVDYLKTWGGTWIEFGTDTGWTNIQNYILSNDMSVQANYQHAKSFYNTGSLIDYYILNSYIVNADWLNWNTAWWRGTNPDGDKKKWRYTLWDMDNTFDHGTNYTGVPDQDPDADPCDPESIGDPGGQGHIPIWNALLDNDEFFADYINRWTDLSNNYFSCDFLLSHLDSLIGIIEPEMPAQIGKWGGNYATWESNVEDMRNFIEDRCEMINSGILDCYEDDYGIEGPYNVTILIEPPLSGTVEMNGFSLDEYPFSGAYFGGINQELEALPTTDYLFDHWEFLNTTASSNTNDSIVTYNLSSNDTIIAHFAPHTVLTLDVSPAQTGTITIDGVNYNTFPTEFNINGEITVEAIAEEGFVFDHWELSNGVIANVENSTTNLFINEDASLIAYFVPQEFNVVFDISHENGGEISINGTPLTTTPQNVTFVYGETYTISLTLNEDFELNHWSSSVTPLNFPNSETYNLTLYESDTITAHLDQFFNLSFELSSPNAGYVLADGEEMLLLPESQKFIENTILNIQAIPSIDMNFEYWARKKAIIEYAPLFEYTVEEDDTLRAIFSEKDITLFVPNSFTPNGDQINDVFKPIGIADKIKSYHMSIFNEWGELLFESNDIENGWTAHNIEANSNNVFIYKIVIYSELTGSKYQYKGTVLVL